MESCVHGTCRKHDRCILRVSCSSSLRERNQPGPDGRPARHAGSLDSNQTVTVSVSESEVLTLLWDEAGLPPEDGPHPLPTAISAMHLSPPAPTSPRVGDPLSSADVEGLGGFLN